MNKLKLISLVKICAFTVFLGRAYQLYFFGAPFRAFLWDENLLTPVVEGIFNYSWFDYATNPAVNEWIDGFTKAVSIIFFVAAIVSLFWDRIKLQKLKRIVVRIALILLFLIGICVVKDRNYEFLQLFELFIQFTGPVLLLYDKKLNSVDNKNIVLGIKIAIACTFIAHGLYAMGLVYLPGHFVDMTIILLGFTEPQVGTFLYVVGLLDIIMSILIFVPKFSKYALIYMIFWGLLTAFARFVAGYNKNFIEMSFYNYTYLVIYRLSHGLIPLLVLLMEEKIKKKITKYPIYEN
jgi:hypothetical protein